MGNPHSKFHREEKLDMLHLRRLIDKNEKSAFTRGKLDQIGREQKLKNNHNRLETSVCFNAMVKISKCRKRRHIEMSKQCVDFKIKESTCVSVHHTGTNCASQQAGSELVENQKRHTDILPGATDDQRTSLKGGLNESASNENRLRCDAKGNVTFVKETNDRLELVDHPKNEKIIYMVFLNLLVILNSIIKQWFIENPVCKQTKWKKRTFSVVHPFSELVVAPVMYLGNDVPITQRNELLHESVRFRTFQMCHMNLPAGSSLRLAAAGFYYDQNIIQCVFCGHNLCEDSIQRLEFDEYHQHNSPRCPSFRGNHVSGNTPMVEYGHFDIQRDVQHDTVPLYDEHEMLNVHRYPPQPPADVPCTARTERSTDMPEQNPEEAQYSRFNNEGLRMESFRNWPTTMSQKPMEMAKAGFFFTGVRDLCRCFHCDVLLHSWEPHDDPWVEHARSSPRCRYLIQKKGNRYIQQWQQAHVSEEIQAMLEDNERLKLNMVCKICLDAEANIVFLPCGHMVNCPQCAPAFLKCPICQNPVKKYVKALK